MVSRTGTGFRVPAAPRAWKGKGGDVGSGMRRDRDEVLRRLLADPCATLNDDDALRVLLGAVAEVLVTQTSDGARVDPGSEAALFSPVPGAVDLGQLRSALGQAAARGPARARRNAARLVGEVATTGLDVSDLVAPLLAALRDEAADVAEAAADALAPAVRCSPRVDWAPLLPRVAEALRGDPAVDFGLLHALRAMAGRSVDLGPALPALEAALSRPVARPLGQLLAEVYGPRLDREGFLRLLRHPDREVRSQAALALGRRPEVTVALGLAGELGSLHGGNEHAALARAGEHGADVTAAVPGLVAYLAGKLGEAGGFAIIDAMFAFDPLAVAAGQGADVRRAAPVVLAWLAPERLREGTHENVVALRRDAARVLARAARQGCDVGPALGPLATMLSGHDPELVEAAAAALGELAASGPEGPGRVAEALRTVRIPRQDLPAVRALLGRLGPGQA